jgi:2-polyprenyl-3-methyl-5-hydroxy-6-metoxy-1,4-benzoquinol methylase
MDRVTNIQKEHHDVVFKKYGDTAKGVDWNDEGELLIRYDKMLSVMQKDFTLPLSPASILDVGCGWGGLLRRAIALNITLDYTGIDVVNEMILHGESEFTNAKFVYGDVFDLSEENIYDFVVCNGILTQKHDVSIPDMEKHAKRLVRKMFELCRHGIVFNMMSTRVNFMVNNLYYQNPVELLSWLLTEVSPRVKLDHGYSCLGNGKGKLYEFTAYVYKD